MEVKQVPNLDTPEHEHAEIIRTTARQCWSAEAAIDLALRETSLLVASVIDGRVAAGLAPCFVQKALAQVGSTQSALFQTRASMMEAHTELRSVQERMGAGGVKLGGLNKDDHDGPREDATWGWPFGLMSNVVPLQQTAVATR